MKEYLSRKGIPFIEKNVAADRAAAQEMVRKSGQMGVPVITVDNEIVIGFDVQALERLLGKTRRTRPSLGLRVADATRIATTAAESMPRGAYIGAVTPDSPAGRAGLRIGDVIIALAGQTVSSADDVAQIVSSQSAGSPFDIVFVREGITMRRRITL